VKNVLLRAIILVLHVQNFNHGLMRRGCSSGFHNKKWAKNGLLDWRPGSGKFGQRCKISMPPTENTKPKSND